MVTAMPLACVAQELPPVAEEVFPGVAQVRIEDARIENSVVLATVRSDVDTRIFLAVPAGMACRADAAIIDAVGVPGNACSEGIGLPYIYGRASHNVQIPLSGLAEMVGRIGVTISAGDAHELVFSVGAPSPSPAPLAATRALATQSAASTLPLASFATMAVAMFVYAVFVGIRLLRSPSTGRSSPSDENIDTITRT